MIPSKPRLQVDNKQNDFSLIAFCIRHGNVLQAMNRWLNELCGG